MQYEKYQLPDGTYIELPYVVRPKDKSDGLITLTELWRKKLLPAEPPVAWTTQRFDSRVIVWLYEANKTKPYKYVDLPDYVKKKKAAQLKRYREKCTCDLCRHRQKNVGDVSYHDVNGKRMKLCEQCRDLQLQTK